MDKYRRVEEGGGYVPSFNKKLEVININSKGSPCLSLLKVTQALCLLLFTLDVNLI